MQLEQKLKPNTIENKNYNRLLSLFAIISKVVDITDIDIEHNINFLLNNYCSGADRYYHNFTHIDNMIDHVNRYIETNQVPMELPDSIALYTAIIYHDVIGYDEEASAKIFLEHFKQDREICDTFSNWADKDFYDRVVTLIMITTTSPWSIDYHRFDPRYIIIDADWSAFYDYQALCIYDVLVLNEIKLFFNLTVRKAKSERKKFLKTLLHFKDTVKNDIRLENLTKLLKEKYH